jgi:DNA-binding NarL/FixJ family response regulator/anti-sigma regulatory factor (Ser/Thr protein kinase)
MEPYRIVLADDHVIFRMGIRQLIDTKPDLEVVGEAGDGLELMNLLKSGLKTDMAIVDITMPKLRGIEALYEIKNISPEVKVLMLTMHLSKEYLYQSISAGAHGYLLKEDSEVELFSAIDAIRKGEMYISNLFLSMMWRELSFIYHFDSPLLSHLLSSNEREVLMLTTEEKTYNQIADLLCISDNTVVNHLTNIMNKLKVEKSSDLLKLIERGKRYHKFWDNLESSSLEIEEYKNLIEEYKNKIEKYKTICNAIAHDLKNEFLHIGHSITEIKDCIPTQGDILEEVDMIERSITYSRMLMQRLSNFLDMGTLRREPVDLLMLLKEAEKFSKPRIPSNIRLLIKIPSKIKKTVILANREQLMGVLLEFIQNAAKALQNSGGTIEVALENKKEKVFIYVKDDGQGIPGEFRKKVFKEQIPNKEGSGLGLYLSHKVVSEFGGEIMFSTKTGRGTTFTIIFPTIEEKNGVDKCP